MKILGVLACATVGLAGCASLAPQTGATPLNSAPATTASLAPSSVPCPIIDQAPLPPECIPYDPQAMMDSNERYKDRYPVAAESFAAFEAKREDVTTAIEALQNSGDLSPEAVKAILVDAGIGGTLDSAFAWQNDDGITFGGAGPQGGCVEGTATATTLEMAVLGPIMDGGCTAAIGH